MKPQRLNDLDDLLELLYEKKALFEREATMSASPDLKFELKQRLKREIEPRILQYETEYGEIVATSDVTIDNAQAEIIVAEIDDAVTAIEQRPRSEVLPEILAEIAKLREQFDQLDPTVAADAKLKVALPIIPTIVSYELQIDTEGMFIRLRDKIQRLRQTLIR